MKRPQRSSVLRVCAMSLMLMISFTSWAQSQMETCLINKMQTMDDDTTIGELKVICSGESTAKTIEPSSERASSESANVPVYELSALQERSGAEMALEERPFVITPHNPNYILYSFFNDPNQTPFEAVTGMNSPGEDTER